MTDLRPATSDDAPVLVDVVIMAGEGLPEMAWAEMATEGETVRDVGLRRAARADGAFSFRNARVLLDGDRVMGGIVGYALPDDPVEIGPDFPPEFVALQELENLAPGTWYLNILGVYPDDRNRGHGATMLAEAENTARAQGLRGVSIIVFSSNPGAERLYRRQGYREVARRTMSVPGWRHDGAEAILLVK